MPKVLEISSMQEQRFRGGELWTRTPRRIDPDTLSEAQRAALDDDPVLKIVEVDGEPDEPGSAGALHPLTGEEIEALIRAAIEALAPDGYTQTGQPKMAPLREALSALERGTEIELTQARALESFAAMTAEDFKPPLKEAVA